MVFKLILRIFYMFSFNVFLPRGQFTSAIRRQSQLCLNQILNVSQRPGERLTCERFPDQTLLHCDTSSVEVITIVQLFMHTCTANVPTPPDPPRIKILQQKSQNNEGDNRSNHLVN